MRVEVMDNALSIIRYKEGSREDGMKRSAWMLDQVLSAFPSLRIAIENTAGAGTILGSSFEELDGIISGSACKDRIYVNIDTKDINARLLVDAIKEAGMRDQVMIYTGDRSFAENCQKADINVAVHPYVYSADDVDSYRKGGMTGAVLFQYGNTCIYGDNPADPEIGRKIRAKGFLSYTNLLGQYDNAMLNGDFGYVRQFVDSESDFVQTDYCEKVIEYLELVELR